MATIRTSISIIAVQVSAACESCGGTFSYQTTVSGSSQGSAGLFHNDSWSKLGSEAAAQMQASLAQALKNFEYPLRRCPHCEHLQSWMYPRYAKVRNRLIAHRFAWPAFVKTLGASLLLGLIIMTFQVNVGLLIGFAASPAVALGAGGWVFASMRRRQRALEAGLPRRPADAPAPRQPAVTLTKPDYRPGMGAEDDYLLRYETNLMRQDLLGQEVRKDQFIGQEPTHRPPAPWRCSICGTPQRGRPGGPGEARSTLGVPLFWLFFPLIPFLAAWAYWSYRHHVRCVMCEHIYAPNALPGQDAVA